MFKFSCTARVGIANTLPVLAVILIRRTCSLVNVSVAASCWMDVDYGCSHVKSRVTRVALDTLTCGHHDRSGRAVVVVAP